MTDITESQKNAILKSVEKRLLEHTQTLPENKTFPDVVQEITSLGEKLRGERTEENILDILLSFRTITKLKDYHDEA